MASGSSGDASLRCSTLSESTSSSQCTEELKARASKCAARETASPLVVSTPPQKHTAYRGLSNFQNVPKINKTVEFSLEQDDPRTYDIQEEYEALGSTLRGEDQPPSGAPVGVKLIAKNLRQKETLREAARGADEVAAGLRMALSSASSIPATATSLPSSTATVEAHNRSGASGIAPGGVAPGKMREFRKQCLYQNH